MKLKSVFNYVTLLLLSGVCMIVSEKILFLVLFGTRSHRIAMQPLAEKLVDRGHDVTFLAETKSSETSDPRIQEANFSAIFEHIASQNVDLGADAIAKRLGEGRHHNHLMEGTIWWDIIINAAEAFFTNRQFVEFVKTSHYDLIVVGTIKEVAVVIAYKMNAKVIWMNTGGALHHVDAETLGLPIESNWLPSFALGSPYWFVPDHIYTSFNTLWEYRRYYWYCLRKMDQIIQQNLGKDVPPLNELLQNFDLIFLNERFPYSYPRSLPPYIIPVGGMHVRYTDRDLPKDIQEFIDRYPYFIYISFGSLMHVGTLPTELRQDFFDAVASLRNVGFLWKWNGHVPTTMPSNVMTMEWFPQQAILANPKCKGFVTQGGAMSFQQAIYHAVPMIIIPIWWDQPALARLAVHYGVGIHLELSELTEKSLKSALYEIIFNETYKNMSEAVSSRAKNEPVASVDTAASWVEYTLRHDTKYLKSPSVKQSWWKKRLLDLWFLVFSLVFVACFIVYQTTKLVVRRKIRNRRRSKRLKVL
ncbi:hypothetical protein HA402_005508 [Bradysia odoriphaga]|nr:hypothetical protein HA402_005508 [Bradysia odoriphaga]